MRHNVFGKKLSRNKNERRRLLQILARDVILHDGIVTTKTKAKTVGQLLDKLITNAKKDTNAGESEIRKILADRESTKKLLMDSKKRFINRNSGYTRIINLGMRKSDASMMARVEFSDPPLPTESKAEKNMKTGDKKNTDVPAKKTIKKVSTKK